ncbi:conserved hypothetical protein [uncultured delta proteobacterium]|uniref:Uncharacterized protein n=1 Tax=uncultured delta proteobacterium TaxID=34034 RepID=A0A212K8V7_9DELT|nr:conserved hypothetical protein [uncultured delta proteobacterium]
MDQHQETKRPYYEVFSITEYSKDGETRAAWLRMGAAFQNKDGSFNLLLRAFPLPDPKTGMARLHMRLPQPKTGAETGDSSDSFYLEIDPLMGAPLEEL